MAEVIKWNQSAKKIYNTGVDKGVLFTQEAGVFTGVPWEGLISVTESPSGAEANELYANNVPYLSIISAEMLGGTIEAYMSPKEFDACDGAVEVGVGMSIGQQNRKQFVLAYRTLIGNEEDGDQHGYVITIIYDCFAQPAERANKTIGEKTDPLTLSWEFKTTAVPVTDHKPTSKLTFDSRTINAGSMAMLEEMLYGDDDVAATYPAPDMLYPDELIALLELAAI